MNKKISSKKEEIRKRVYEFYLNYRNVGKKFTYNHFKTENIPRSSIYKIIKRAESKSGYQRVQGNGGKAKKIYYSLKGSNLCLTIKMEFLKDRELKSSTVLSNTLVKH